MMMMMMMMLLKVVIRLIEVFTSYIKITSFLFLFGIIEPFSNPLGILLPEVIYSLSSGVCLSDIQRIDFDAQTYWARLINTNI